MKRFIYCEVMKITQCAPSSSSPQWFCGGMPAMENEQSAHKHYARSLKVHYLKQKLVHDTQSS